MGRKEIHPQRKRNIQIPFTKYLSTSHPPGPLLLDTYVSQRANPSDEKAKELFNIIVGEKTQNTRINTNLDEFKLQTLIDNHQEAIQEMSLGGIKLKSVLELRQKVDQWLRAQMKAMDEAKNNTKPEGPSKDQREHKRSLGAWRLVHPGSPGVYNRIHSTI